MNKRILTISCWIFFAGFLLAASYLNHLVRFAHTPGSLKAIKEVIVERGTGLKAISENLEKQGLIRRSLDFYIYVRFVAREWHLFKAGEYDVDGHMSPVQIMALLEKGLRKEIRVTIPEGVNKSDIARILATAFAKPEKEILDAMKEVPEGYLFPDTYQFPKGDPIGNLVQRMRKRLDEKIDASIQDKMKARHMDLNQLLTFASLVEKETALDEERPMIASVFWNRLKIGMRLQTDPTVIYAKGVKGRITKADLSLPHAYNTYVNPGLPPGPIASPGIEAIMAVLSPAQTKYLYFVSRNNGSHEFCKNLACHNRAVRKWQLN